MRTLLTIVRTTRYLVTEVSTLIYINNLPKDGFENSIKYSIVILVIISNPVYKIG